MAVTKTSSFQRCRSLDDKSHRQKHKNKNYLYLHVRFLISEGINWNFSCQIGKAKVKTVHKAKKNPRPLGKQSPRDVPWKRLFMNFRNKKRVVINFAKFLKREVIKKRTYSFNNKIQQVYTVIMSQHHSISWYQTQIFSVFTYKAITYNVIFWQQTKIMCLY